MVLSENGGFLAELGSLYEQSRSEGRGSVWITIKRTFPELDGVRGLRRKRALQNEEASHAMTCLVRATNGKRKISTQVHPESMAHFSNSLMGVIRVSADEIRPKEAKVLRKEGQRPTALATDGQKRAGKKVKPGSEASDDKKGGAHLYNSKPSSNEKREFVPG
ncbi:signal recognition particle 14 kda [Cystoisospora suis]|uniref:Signal recognition particle 14 kDa protein n=1 Tax=Cystoisospora suis TaxID=483139 RepID=A0A2C6L8N7_9APIC|nr:signal recognition particle 14 kda [Cystoisospora suis]